MAYCSQCGTQLPTGARFCTECGTAIGSQSAVTRPVDASPLPADEPQVSGAAATSTATPRPVEMPAQPPRPAPATIAAPRVQPSVAPDLDPAPVADRVDQPIPRRSPPAANSNAAMWILPALIVLAVLAFGWWWLTRDTVETAAAPGQEQGAPARGGETGDDEEGAATASGSESARGDEDTTFVSAATIDAAFARDRNAAALRYAGPVTVTGTIATMVQPGSTPSLSMEGRTPFNYMIVNFTTDYRARLAPLMKGQTITVACSGARHLGATTILSDCALS